jgi:flagellar export protein FliJ
MTKVFTFRLERLLEVRRLREEIARRDWGVAQRELRDQKRRVLELLLEEDQGKSAVRSIKVKLLNLDQLRLHESYLSSLERRISEARARFQELLKAEAEKRRLTVEARKRVRVLERFREKKRQAYLYEAGRQEQKFLDEVAQNASRQTG